MAAKKHAPRTKIQDLHLVTDTMGGMARHLLDSLLARFPAIRWRVTYHSYCRTLQQIEEACGQAPKRALLCSAVVDPEFKAAVLEACQQRGLRHCDLIGGCTDFLARHTGCALSCDGPPSPSRDPAYRQRIDSLEFTLQHDDNRRIESIGRADIVLVGVSRSGKTPTSAYLGWMGYRVANISICVETELPVELRRCKGRIVAFTIQPQQLAEIRCQRMERNQLRPRIEAIDSIGYYDVRQVIREVMTAEAIFREQGFPIIDITQLTIEEAAARVLERLNLKSRTAQ